jgi:diacylglycerol kinase family enzyme
MDLISAYANGVSELARFSHEEEQPPLVVDVIVNPRAGFFKSQGVVARQIKELEKKLADLRERAPRRKVEINRVHYTEHQGHARLITEDLLDAESSINSGMEHLLIGCGGDGTSNEICTALVHADGAVLDRLKLLRLPLGTGNDVADAHTFAEAYDLILGSQPVVRTGALRVTASGSPARYSFNIASIGLDAFIAALTNKFKRVIPGDAYKSLVDIGSLFYETKVKPLPIDVTLHGEAGENRLVPLVPSMVIMGISGGRTYGGHLPVLPGEDNVCVVRQMGVFAKIRNKKLFYLGRHGELPEVTFYKAARMDVDYKGSIPMQLDGEQVWLTPQDFPVRMEVLSPRIKVLRR